MSRYLALRRAMLPTTVVDLAEQVAAAGYKVTGPRLAVLRAIAACTENTFSVHELDLYPLRRAGALRQLRDAAGHPAIRTPDRVSDHGTFGRVVWPVSTLCAGWSALNTGHTALFDNFVDILYHSRH